MERQVSDIKTEPIYPYYINCDTKVTVSIGEGEDLPKLYQSNCFYKCDGVTIYVASTKSTVANDKGLEYKPSLIQTTICTCTEVVSEDECRECRTESTCNLGSTSIISSYINDVGIDEDSGYVCNIQFLGYTNACSIVDKDGKTYTYIDECTLKVYDNEYYVYDNNGTFSCIVCGTKPSGNCTLCRIDGYNDLYRYTFNGNAWSGSFKPMYVYNPMDCNKFVECIDNLVEGEPIPATYTYTEHTNSNGNYYNVKEDKWQSDEISIDPPYHAIYVAQCDSINTSNEFTGHLIGIVCCSNWDSDKYDKDTGIAYTSKALPSTSISIAEFDFYQLCGTVNDTTFTPTTWCIICKETNST